MGLFFLTSDLMEAARGQKHLSDAENGMKESIYWKKFLMKVAQQPQKPLTDQIRFELQPQGRKLWFLIPPRSQFVHAPSNPRRGYF